MCPLPTSKSPVEGKQLPPAHPCPATVAEIRKENNVIIHVLSEIF